MKKGILLPSFLRENNKTIASITCWILETNPAAQRVNVLNEQRHNILIFSEAKKVVRATAPVNFHGFFYYFFPPHGISKLWPTRFCWSVFIFCGAMDIHTACITSLLNICTACMSVFTIRAWSNFANFLKLQVEMIPSLNVCMQPPVSLLYTHTNMCCCNNYLERYRPINIILSVRYSQAGYTFAELSE